ncbi:coiled-coil domain-containing protein [Acrasis kona]|uniref:Dynein regulatory complex subunit 2 n=1 Tax=Acrasis kona TaxID=1008807 RepID=A0AAW2Z4D0_9EUKA
MKLDNHIKGSAQDTPVEENPESAENTATLLQDVARLKEEENRKKREEHLKAKLMEMKLEEDRFSKSNKIKIQNNWLKILREAKVQELKQQIQILAQAHDRQVDRKDAVVQMLYRDLDESEEQYRLALRTHLQHTDELLELQSKIVENLSREFNNDLYLLKTEYEEERNEILETFKRDVKEWQEIDKEMHKRHLKINEQMETEHAQTKEHIKNKYNENFNVMSMLLESEFKSVEDASRDENESHTNEMDAKFKEYLVQRGKDDDTTDEIKGQIMRIKIFEDSLANWRAKWLNNLRECEERNKQLVHEKNVLAKHFKTLKLRMQRFREGEEKRLKDLVKMSKETRDVLEEKLERAKRILQVAELNRKMETEREKILPFESDLDGKNGFSLDGLENQDKINSTFTEEDEVMAEIQKTAQMQHAAENQSEWEMFHRFYKKYSKVLLDKTALEQEKVHLAAQNEQLRQMLKDYLDGISVNEDVLNNKNPLLMIESLEDRRQMQHVVVNANPSGNSNIAMTRL